MSQAWSNSTLNAKLKIDTDALENLCGPNHVDNTLFTLMQQAYGSHKTRTNGMVYTVYAPPCTGKTHCAATLLKITATKPIARGMLISGGKRRDSYTPFDEVLANALGVRYLSIHDRDWIEWLFLALSGTAKPSAGSFFQRSFDQLMDSVLTMCGVWGCAKREVVKNEPGQYPPVLILDDFSSLLDTDKVFVKQVAQWASRKRVLVFIMTDVERVAYDICQLNCFERIRPLPGTCDEANLVIGVPITLNRLQWLRKELTELVLLQYEKKVIDAAGLFDDAGLLTFVTDGMTPLGAISAAENELQVFL
jgi:hypothetical protein